MLKIYKCFKLPKSSPQRITCPRRCFSNKDCPKYDCKRPPEVDEFEEQIRSLKESIKPQLFVCRPHKDVKTLKAIFFFLCIPSIIFAYVNIMYFKEEHQKRLKFVEFSYLRIRNQPFPWDPVRTLFHNPKLNALPTGYEVEVPEEEEEDPFEKASDRWFYRGKMV